jgi:hypothetical protein
MVYFVYKNKYRIFKSVEITIRKGTKVERRKKRGDEPIWVIIHKYMDTSQ